MKNTYKVVINRQQYSIVSDETADQVTRAAQLVDQLIQEISVKAPHVEEKKIAVLVALQLASKLLGAQQELAAVDTQQAHLIAYLEKECLAALR